MLNAKAAVFAQLDGLLLFVAGILSKGLGDFQRVALSTRPCICSAVPATAGSARCAPNAVQQLCLEPVARVVHAKHQPARHRADRRARTAAGQQAQAWQEHRVPRCQRRLRSPSRPSCCATAEAKLQTSSGALHESQGFQMSRTAATRASAIPKASARSDFI